MPEGGLGTSRTTHGAESAPTPLTPNTDYATQKRPTITANNLVEREGQHPGWPLSVAQRGRHLKAKGSLPQPPPTCRPAAEERLPLPGLPGRVEVQLPTHQPPPGLSARPPSWLDFEMAEASGTPCPQQMAKPGSGGLTLDAKEAGL